MKQQIRSIVSLFLVCAILLSSCGFTIAGPGDVTIDFGSYSPGNHFINITHSGGNLYSNGTPLGPFNPATDVLTLKGNLNGVVSIDVASPLNIRLNNVSVTQPEINNSQQADGALVILPGSNVTLTLVAGSTNSFIGSSGNSSIYQVPYQTDPKSGGRAGISVASSGALTINGSGQLIAKGGDGDSSGGGGAGIGSRGGYYESDSPAVGSITINGGTIIATGGNGSGTHYQIDSFEARAGLGAHGRGIGGGGGGSGEGSGSAGGDCDAGIIINGGFVSVGYFGIGGGPGGNAGIFSPGNNNDGGKGGNASVTILGGIILLAADTRPYQDGKVPLIGGGSGGYGYNTDGGNGGNADINITTSGSSAPQIYITQSSYPFTKYINAGNGGPAGMHGFPGEPGQLNYNADVPINPLPTAKYVVLFDTDGGVPDSWVEVYDEGFKVPRPDTDPSKDDFTFDAWYWDGTYFEFNTSIAENMVLTARYIPIPPQPGITHTVTFDANGGTPAPTSPQTINDGAKVPRPMDPEKTGFTFVGWRMAHEGGVPFDFNTNVFDDYHLVAYYTPIYVPPPLDPDEIPGALLTSKSANQTTATLDQWDITVSLNGLDLISPTDVVLVIDRSGSMVNNNRMVNTKVAAKAFVDALLKENSNTRIALVAFSNDSDMIQGFTDDKDLLKSQIDSINPTGGTHLQSGIHLASQLADASSAKNKYIVLLGDGEPTYSYKVTDYTDDNPTVLSCTEHPNLVGQFVPVVDFDMSAITLTFDYGIRSGNGMFDFISGAYSNDPSLSHGDHTHKFPHLSSISAIYEANLAKQNVTKIYTVAFGAGVDGTQVLEDCASSPSDSYAMNDDNPAALNAAFSEIAGNIAYAATEAVVTDEIGQHFDLVGTVLDIVISQGTVNYYPSNETIIWNIGTIQNATCPVTMKYTVQMDGSAPSGLLGTNGPTKVDYKDVNGADQTIIFEVPMVSSGHGSIRMYSYLLDEHGVPLNAQGFQAYNRAEISYLEAVYYETGGSNVLPYTTYTVTAPPVRQFGSAYAGFVNGTTANLGDESPKSVTVNVSNQSVALYFAYQVLDGSFDVKFHANNVSGQTVTNMPVNTSVNAGALITKPADPISTGYVFDGWHSDAAGTSPWDFTVDPVIRDIDLYAKWINMAGVTYTVTFDGNGAISGVPAPQTVAHGDIPRYLSTPIKEGHEFKEWTLDGLPYNLATPVLNDLTLVADYTDMTTVRHTVTFNTDGGLPVPEDQQVVHYGLVTRPTPDPVKPGYDFSAWSAYGDGFQFTYRIWESTELTAIYNVNDSDTATIAVKFYENGTYLSGRDSSINAIWAGENVTSSMVTVPTGYKLAATTPFSPSLPTIMADGSTLTVNVEKDPTATATITVQFYESGTHLSGLDGSITVWAGDPITSSDVTPPAGYVFDGAAPFTPNLPALMADGSTLKVNLSKNLSQTILINVEYYIGGTHDPLRDTTITPWVGMVYVTDVTIPPGYVLSSTNPVLPMKMSNGETLEVYLVTQGGNNGGGNGTGGATIVNPEEPSRELPSDDGSGDDGTGDDGTGDDGKKEELPPVVQKVSWFWMFLIYILALLCGCARTWTNRKSDE